MHRFVSTSKVVGVQLGLLACSALLLSTVLLAERAAAGTHALLLPDMFPFVEENPPSGMETLQVWNLSGTTLSYRTIFANQGDGYFEIRRGSNIDSARDEMLQRTYSNSDGTGSFIDISIGSMPVLGSPGNPAPGVLSPYNEQTTVMWNENFAKFSLLEAPVVNGVLTVGAEVAGTTKASWRLSNNVGPLPGYSTTALNGDQSTNQRIAVGWADLYSGGPGQSFDISGVPAGPKYWLRQTVDPNNRIAETDETNNSFEILIDLNSPGAAILDLNGNFLRPGDPSSLSAGDLNQDTVVDVSDWLKFQAEYDTDLSSMTPAQAYLFGDLNGDGQHSLLDFSLFRTAFLDAGNLASLLTPIPEPSSWALFCFGCILLGARRRNAPSSRAKSSFF